jgi:hypothetical protein
VFCVVRVSATALGTPLYACSTSTLGMYVVCVRYINIAISDAAFSTAGKTPVVQRWYIPAKSIVFTNTFDAVFGNDKWKILHDCTVARDPTAFAVISCVSFCGELQSCSQIFSD